MTRNTENFTNPQARKKPSPWVAGGSLETQPETPADPWADAGAAFEAALRDIYPFVLGELARYLLVLRGCSRPSKRTPRFLRAELNAVLKFLDLDVAKSWEKAACVAPGILNDVVARAGREGGLKWLDAGVVYKRNGGAK